MEDKAKTTDLKHDIPCTVDKVYTLGNTVSGTYFEGSQVLYLSNCELTQAQAKALYEQNKASQGNK